MYAMLGSWPDIGFAVNQLTQYGSNPVQSHLNTPTHVLCYLRATQAHQFTYGQNDSSKLIAYSNSDWAANTDTCCSMTGFCFIFTGACVSWTTHKQCTVTLSSTEAEYMAFTACAKHAKWTISLLQQLDFDVDLLLEIFSDSLGARAIAENPTHHDQTKHTDIQHHYIQDHIPDGTLHISPISSKDNIADVLTKSFCHDWHAFLKKKLGIVSDSIVGEYLKDDQAISIDILRLSQLMIELQ